ncbi:hypothetical protein FIBSPDRAFT_874498 [Athelia psychrophila]|uniref:Uncharacterized protein n=1 Tax=Athelia psychrophila TaxID=1759441 RepID=A0A165XI14_9AGAM|nr:hypothetical protein FIBSPDRAFT_874498 [Fibularhizoctonia sp. CBS 109695]
MSAPWPYVQTLAPRTPPRALPVPTSADLYAYSPHTRSQPVRALGSPYRRQPALTRATRPHIHHGRSYIRAPSSTQTSPPAVHSLSSRAGTQSRSSRPTHTSEQCLCRHSCTRSLGGHNPTQDLRAPAPPTLAHAYQVRPIPCMLALTPLSGSL